MTKLDQLLQEMRNEMGNDFVASQVIDEEGLPIASITTHPEIDDNMSSSRMMMIYTLARKVSDKLALGRMEEELMTVDGGYFILRSLGDGSHCMTLAVTKDAILGTARMYMTEYGQKIWEAIPHA